MLKLLILATDLGTVAFYLFNLSSVNTENMSARSLPASDLWGLLRIFFLSVEPACEKRQRKTVLRK